MFYLHMCNCVFMYCTLACEDPPLRQQPNLLADVVIKVPVAFAGLRRICPLGARESQHPQEHLHDDMTLRSGLFVGNSKAANALLAASVYVPSSDHLLQIIGCKSQ